jgi:hypothetical protein
MTRKPSMRDIEYLLHLFLLFLIQNPTPDPPASATEVKRNYYLLKLLGLIWFEDGERKNGTNPSCYLNIDWPCEPTSTRLKSLISLDSSTLEWLSKNMQKPQWAVEDCEMKEFSFTGFWETVTGIPYDH